MTRAQLSMRILVVLGASALVACGPRLKPVEYEEPKLSGSGAPDDETSSTHSSKPSKSSASTDEASDSSAATTSKKNGKSCDDKTPCGTPCTECAPGNLDCMEVLVEKQCNLDHKCVAAPANCALPEKGSKDKKAKDRKE